MEVMLWRAVVGQHRYKPQAGCPVDSAASGLLDMPNDWQHELIICLPPKDRLALFQTCRQLCRQVVSNSPSVTLQLYSATERQFSKGLLGWLAACWYNFWVHRLLILPIVLGLMCELCKRTGLGYPGLGCDLVTGMFVVDLCPPLLRALAPLRLWRRPSIIEGILCVNRSLRLVTRGKGDLPLRRHLRHLVTAVELHDDISGTGYARFSWSDFTSLHQLAILGRLYGFDMKHLNRAIEAGHLQHLRQLALYPTDVHYPKGSCIIEEAIARKLGGSLTHIATNCCGLWNQLQKFTSLQTLEIGATELHPDIRKQSYASITPDVVRQLCEHPTLRKVTFRACSLPDTWASSQIRSHWETVNFQ